MSTEKETACDLIVRFSRTGAYGFSDQERRVMMHALGKTFGPVENLPSRSYPYLWASRAVNADYGEVLQYVDFMERDGKHVSQSPLAYWQCAVVLDVWQGEMERRRK